MAAALWFGPAMIALGAAIGVVAGVFGNGGGVIAIPVLGLFCGLDQHVAQGTALLMVVPNIVVSFWRYRRRGGIDLRIAATLGMSAVLSTYPAARFATGLDAHVLRRAFAGFLVVLAAVTAYRLFARRSVPPPRRPLAWGWAALLGLAGGIASGLFGVGGSFLAPPVLTGFFGIRQAEAQGLAIALVTPGSIVALATYAAAGKVDWALGLPLALGGVLSISLGVAVAHRLPERRLRLGFCGLLVAVGALLALRG